VAEAISQTPLVLALDSEQIEAMSELMTIKTYKSGQIICQADEIPKASYLLLEGTVSLRLPETTNSRSKQNHLSPERNLRLGREYNFSQWEVQRKKVSGEHKQEKRPKNREYIISKASLHARKKSKSVKNDRQSLTVDTTASVPILEVNKGAPWLFSTKVLWKENQDLKVSDGVHVISKTKSRVAILSTKGAQRFRDLTDKTSSCKSKIKDVFDSGIIEMLKSIDFLRDLSNEELLILSRTFHYRILAPNEVLFSEGSEGKEFYMVFKGEVEVFKKIIGMNDHYTLENKDEGKLSVHRKSKQETLSTIQGLLGSIKGMGSTKTLHHAHSSRKIRDSGAGGDERRVSTLGAGKFFGEITLLTDMPRTATIKGSPNCSYSILLSIDKEDFNKFVEAVELDFVEVMKERICEQFRTTDCPFFKSFPKARMKSLSQQCELMKICKNEWVFKEGEPGDRFYIIVGGSMKVFRDKKEIVKLHTNDYFGEIALISEQPRTAGVKATETSLLLGITKESFRTMFFDRPESLAEVELKILGHRSTIRSVIYHREGFKMFEEFLKEQYAAESLRFWKLARQFRHSMDLVYDAAMNRRHSLVIKETMGSEMAEKLAKDLKVNEKAQEVERTRPMSLGLTMEEPRFLSREPSAFSLFLGTPGSSFVEKQKQPTMVANSKFKKTVPSALRGSDAGSRRPTSSVHISQSLVLEDTASTSLLPHESKENPLLEDKEERADGPPPSQRRKRIDSLGTVETRNNTLTVNTKRRVSQGSQYTASRSEEGGAEDADQVDTTAIRYTPTQSKNGNQMESLKESRRKVAKDRRLNHSALDGSGSTLTPKDTNELKEIATRNRVGSMPPRTGLLEGMPLILNDKQSRQLITQARIIYQEYIRSGAPQQVNIKGSTKEKIDMAIRQGNIDTTLFTEAEKEAIKLLNRDKFNDFKKSQYFKDLLALVVKGTYLVDDVTIKGTRKARRKSAMAERKSIQAIASPTRKNAALYFQSHSPRFNSKSKTGISLIMEGDKTSKQADKTSKQTG